jgi:hypothetical protein
VRGQRAQVGNLGRKALVAAFGRALGALDAPFDRGQIGQAQLDVDGLDVAHRVHRALNVHHVRVTEHAHDDGHSVDVTDVSEKLIAQALAAARTPHEPRDVDKLHRRGHDAPGAHDLVQLVQPLVGHLHDAHVGLDRGKRIVGGHRTGRGEGVEQRGLADVWQARDTHL